MATAAADNQATQPRTPAPGATEQLGYSGTPRGPDGITQPDEYVRELADPVRRMEKFEEMGHSDDAVHTAIDARRQEINAANWTLSTEDKGARGTEILEFVEDNIYPYLDDILRWLGGGAIQYGFGLLEPVYAWADAPFTNGVVRGDLRRPTRASGRAIYLRKLAHILARSVYSFQIAETGDLTNIVQWVFNGATYRRVEIPPEKPLLWTYNRQGDDYWGVPPTRHCFKAWTFKQQIERLNLLHIDKFGVGTVAITEGEGWGEADRKKAAAFAAAWRSTDRNYILVPQGGQVQILADEGKTTMSILEWVKYYNLQIAKTFLTQGTELGSTETGARALGETFLEQLGGIVQADCEDLASLINNRLIIPLVQWNFGPQKAYPAFAPSQRVHLGGGIAQMLQQLIAAGAVHPRPEDEAFLRDAFGMPAVDIKLLQQEQDDRKARAPVPGQPPTPGQPPVPGQPPTERPAGEIGPRRVAASRHAHNRPHQLAAMADGAPDPAVPGQTSYRTREYAEWESRILRPEILTRDLDLQAARLTGEVQDVLKAIDAELTRQVEAHANDSAEALSGAVRTIAVPDKLRKQLREVLFAAAQRARDYGDQAVRKEIERQVGPDGIGATRPSWLYPTEPAPGSWYDRFVRGVARTARALVQGDLGGPSQEDEQRARDLRLAAQVDAAVESEVDRREQNVRSSILTALAQAGAAIVSTLAAVVKTAATAGLEALSTGRTQQAVQSVVNVGFGIGRSDAADQINVAAGSQAPASGGGSGRSGLRDADGNPIGLIAKVYSAVMDLGTCDECAKWDGAEFPIDYPEDFTGVQCPNPRCEGTEQRCRCVWIYITDRESVPLVPAAKGPEPARGIA
jgi:hypothetical protein